MFESMEPTESRKEACRRLAPEGEREGSDLVQLGQGENRTDVDGEAAGGCTWSRNEIRA